MKKKTEKSATPDYIWKLLITKLFKEFLEVFKPDLLKDIIPEKTEFLEKELISLTGTKKLGIVDILAKVFMKDGRDEYILLHIEVQGKNEIDFSERMFAYFIRIWDKYRKPITSVAIITERNTFRNVSNELVIKSYGTVQRFKYTLIDITRFNYNNCIRSNNPVRAAVGMFSSDSNETKWKRKAEIIKRLDKLGLDQEKINILMAFVERLKPMNKEEFLKFEEYVEKNCKGEATMIITSFEERGIKKGMQKGMRKGIQKGIQKGMTEGIQKGIGEGLLRGKIEGIHTTAKKMRELGIEISLIQKATGLSEAEINKL